MSKETRFSKPHWLLSETEDREMKFAIVLAAIDLHEKHVQQFKQLLIENSVVINSTSILSNNKSTELSITASTHQAWDLFQRLLSIAADANFDVAVLPVSTRMKKLMICDMDSTIVRSETLDDIAEKVGIGERVKAITTRAMQGEMGFSQALAERVRMLEGIAEDVFDEIANTVQFNSGAGRLVGLARQRGLRTVLVSGGFEPIVKVVADKLGFDRCVCNKIDVSNGQLTGKVLEPIVDGGTKLKVLMEECKQLAISPDQACTIGDGANDIPMLQAAGLGISYQGKPVVCASIPYQINSTGLEFVLSMMGITV